MANVITLQSLVFTNFCLLLNPEDEFDTVLVSLNRRYLERLKALARKVGAIAEFRDLDMGPTKACGHMASLLSLHRHYCQRLRLRRVQ